MKLLRLAKNESLNKNFSDFYQTWQVEGYDELFVLDNNEGSLLLIKDSPQRIEVMFEAPNTLQGLESIEKNIALYENNFLSAFTEKMNQILMILKDFEKISQRENDLISSFPDFYPFESCLVETARHIERWNLELTKLIKGEENV